MEKPLNHLCFEVAAGDILGRLYQAFPEPLSLVYKLLYAEAKESGRMPPHCRESYSHYSSLYGATFAFLQREGLVHAESVDFIDATNAVLTSKGFIALNRPIEAITRSGEERTLGSSIIEAGKLVGTTALSAAIQALLQQGMK